MKLVLVKRLIFSLVSLLIMVYGLKTAMAEVESSAISPVFSGITEIVMVVEDLDASVKKQWEIFGIGPWKIWTLDQTNVKNMMIHGVYADFSIRIAYTKMGNIHWELIEPLDKKSTYYEFLQQHGEGIHNIVFSTKNYTQTLIEMKERGIGIFNSGRWGATRFVNFDTRGYLPVIAEIYDTADDGGFPDPESVYP